ncbi:MAG: hypothetical protein ACTTKW_05145 [Schwartzia sp. (in: firmicutes)]
MATKQDGEKAAEGESTAVKEKGAKASAPKGKGVETNAKALQFQEFLIENDISVFSTETLDDEYQTVVFRSRVETKGQILPMAIFIDTSVFTLIRTQIVSGIAVDKRDRVAAYINDLNIKYKIFKYYLRPDGLVYLDICLPFVDATFDCKMIQLMLSVLVQHLDAVYEDFMRVVWSRESVDEEGAAAKKQ